MASQRASPPTSKQDAILRFRTQTMLLCALQQRSGPLVYHEPRSKSERSRRRDCDAIANALVIQPKAVVAVTAQLNADSCTIQAISAPIEQTSSSGVSLESEPLVSASSSLPLPSQGSDPEEDEFLTFASAIAVQNPRPVSRRNSSPTQTRDKDRTSASVQKLCQSAPASASVLSRDAIFPFTSHTLRPRRNKFLEDAERYRPARSLPDHVVDLLSGIRDINKAETQEEKVDLRLTFRSHFLVATAQKQLTRFKHKNCSAIMRNLKLVVDGKHSLSPSLGKYENFAINSFDINLNLAHPAILPAIAHFKRISLRKFDDTSFATLVYLLFSAFHECLKAVCEQQYKGVEATLATVLETVGAAAERCTRTQEFRSFTMSYASFLLTPSTTRSMPSDAKLSDEVGDAELNSISEISRDGILNAMQLLVSQVSSFRRISQMKLKDSVLRSLKVTLIELPEYLGEAAHAEKWETTLEAALIDHDRTDEVIALMKEHKAAWIRGWQAETPFRGVVHCESVLASLIFFAKVQSKDNESLWQRMDKSIQESFRAASQTLGTSKLSCPACSTLLDILRHRLGGPFQYRGEHDHHYMCALPSELPDDVLYEMVERYNQKVKSAAEAFVEEFKQDKMLSPDSAAQTSDSSTSSRDEEEMNRRLERGLKLTKV